MRKFLSLFLFLLLTSSLFGTTYYVKNGGSDGANGLSHANAWATIGRADNLTGDQSDNLVLFQCGDTWRQEDWTLACNGTSGHPFTMGAYYYDTSEHRGVSGNRPRIIGSDQVSGWTDTGDGVRWIATHSHTTSRWVWFINTSGTIRWGQKKASSALCIAEYDYYDTGSQIYCYAATDPDTRYASVEAGNLSTAIYKNQKPYIVIENIEFGYWHNRAIFGINDNLQGNITLDGCWIHHIGYYENNPSDCDGVVLSNKGLWIKNCIINDCVDHGVYLVTNGSGDKITSATIEDNVFSNCYHSMLDVMCGGDQYFQDVYIRRNLFYCDVATYDLPYATRQLYMSNGPGGWSNVIVSYNIFLFPVDSAIKVGIGGASNVEFYNNIVYGYSDPYVKSGTYDNSQIFVSDNAQSTGHIFKNNIAVGAKTGFACFFVASAITHVGALDNNCWYQPAGGTRAYTQIGGTSYHYNDYAAWATAVASKGEGGVNHDLWEDPGFVNADGTTAVDYKIVSGSPCRDAGADVSLTSDYWGTVVPQNGTPDIGAHEYTAAGPAEHLFRLAPGTVARIGAGTTVRIKN